MIYSYLHHRESPSTDAMINSRLTVGCKVCIDAFEATMDSRSALQRGQILIDEAYTYNNIIYCKKHKPYQAISMGFKINTVDLKKRWEAKQ